MNRALRPAAPPPGQKRFSFATSFVSVSFLLALACMAVAASVFASAAAATPVHPFLQASSLDGSNTPAHDFDKACGTATDSKGDVYVASANNSAIDVFDPHGNYLTTIANANGPCWLAVDSKGRLYVTETSTGNVLRFTPNAYPFAGVPSYGAPTTVGASTKAKGIAVDPFDDRLYVAKGDRVDVFNPDGTLAAFNEVQRVTVSATGGTYKLSFKGNQTGPLAFNASAAEVQAALQGLASIGAGNVTVTEEFSTKRVTFAGALAATDVEALSTDSTALTGGTAKATVTELVKGFNGRIGEGQLGEASGVAVYSNGANGLRQRFVSVADSAGADRIKIFSGLTLQGLKPRATIDGSQTPDGSFGFGPQGASVAADRANGHLLVYDAAHAAVDEFEATGQYFARIQHPDFEDAGPSAIAVFPQLAEVQSVDRAATGGTFKLSFEGEETGPLAFEAPPETVQAALEGLALIGPGGVTVRGGTGFGPPPYVVAFEPSRGDVPQLTADGSGLTGTSPKVSIATRRDGSAPGRVYVTSGASAGAQVLAFGPLPAPSRNPLPQFTFEVTGGAVGVAAGSAGEVYVSGSAGITVYGPNGVHLTTIPDANNPQDLNVDAAGNVYALDKEGTDKVVRYAPTAYPPTAATKYSATTVVAQNTDGLNSELVAIGLNPANGHIFVVAFSDERINEYDSAAHGSVLLKKEFGHSVLPDKPYDVAVYGANGDVYVSQGETESARAIYVLNAAGTELVGVIDGKDSPNGSFGNPDIAVDQSNGHVLLSRMGEGFVEEYSASGAYVGSFGSFARVPSSVVNSVAIDNSGGPNDGNVYAAYREGLFGFSRLAYGEPPQAVTGAASGVGSGQATMNGTVDPRGFALEVCRFDYVDQAGFEAEGFAGAETAPCAESLEAIGKGTGPVPVHVDLTGLDPGGRYRFRLVAANKFGPSVGETAGFGPPLAITKPASAVLSSEATLRGSVDTGGLATSYRFEYGESEAYGHSTALTELDPGDGAVEVSAPIFGLTPGRTYHFRILAENEAGSVDGIDRTLTTTLRPPPEECPNAALRSGASAALPDCRAYELVTPPLDGIKPQSLIGTVAESSSFDTWLGAPQGGSLLFDGMRSLPGVGGNGFIDQYRSVRGESGWTTALIAPSGTQARVPKPGGVSSDHRYAFWRVSDIDGSLEAGFPDATYLRNPDGSFELLGQGSLGDYPSADGRWISPGGAHIIFSTGSPSNDPAVQLEPAAPPAGIGAIYDRTPDGTTHVVSLLPGDVTPTTDSKYVGVSADGSAVFFEVEEGLYERRGATTLQVAPEKVSFAGSSEGGDRAFYVRPDAGSRWIGNVFAFNAGNAGTTQLTGAGGATVVYVSPDGSHVYFASPEQLDGAAGVPGADNLYVWDGTSTRFIAVLSPRDLEDPNHALFSLAGWTTAVGSEGNAFIGPGAVPARSTPDGSVFVFQSFANLTPYDSEGHSEIYRYDSVDPSLQCVSCRPNGEPPVGEAELQQVNEGIEPGHPLPLSPINALSHIPSVTPDGDAVFFQTIDSLLSADSDHRSDVYEWRDGRLSLISSGQSANADFLYGMSADGHDVYFVGNDSLVPQDQDGGDPSIYDARVGGGFPASTARPCAGDECQGAPAAAPSLPSPSSSSLRDPGNVPIHSARRRCPSGKRAVRRSGRTRCVKKPRHRKAKHRTRNHRGGGK